MNSELKFLCKIKYRDGSIEYVVADTWHWHADGYYVLSLISSTGGALNYSRREVKGVEVSTLYWGETKPIFIGEVDEDV